MSLRDELIALLRSYCRELGSERVEAYGSPTLVKGDLEGFVLWVNIVPTTYWLITYLPHNILKEMNIDILSIDKDSLIEKELIEYFSDIIYRVRHKGTKAEGTEEQRKK